MSETIKFGDLEICVALKPVKNVHLSVYPPHGKVTLVAPTGTRFEIIRAYVATKLAWIKAQQRRMKDQARETPRIFVERESHYIWGRRRLLSIVEKDEKPSVRMDHRRLILTVRPGSNIQKRSEIMQAWQRSLLHEVVPPLITKWERRLHVKVSAYFLQRMKTMWGSCNHKSKHIRLNTELVKKPKDLIEYVIVHEMMHLIEPKHSKRFIALLHEHYPTWHEARAELNELPLRTET
jgi:predicted metal-dependent hydrolase